jgi:hypothetical protein
MHQQRTVGSYEARLVESYSPLVFETTQTLDVWPQVLITTQGGQTWRGSKCTTTTTREEASCERERDMTRGSEM